MKIIKKNVYYCDHCKKKSLSASHISKHEKHCTANPDRECRVCESKNKIRQIVEEYKKLFSVVECIDEGLGVFVVGNNLVTWHGDPICVDDVWDRVDGCPACMLAIIRQCGFNRHYFREDFGEFDFKKELSNYKIERNSGAYLDY